jgi:hypothetical protein
MSGRAFQVVNKGANRVDSKCCRWCEPKQEHEMTIGYETLGESPHKVIVLHGWFGDHTIFHPLCDALTLDEFSHAGVAYRG